MKVECDVCQTAEASVFCCADEAALCVTCDTKVHQANKLASKHPRLSLLHSQSDFPTCDICQEKRAFFFCREDRALLCRDCDFSVHSVNNLTGKHSRFLVPGIKVSLHPVLADTSPSSCISSAGASTSASASVCSDKEIEKEKQVFHKTNPLTDLPIFPPKSANVNQGAGKGDITQYLNEVEEFLASSSPARLDWFYSKGQSDGEDIGKALAAGWVADVGLSVPVEALYRETMAEVPQGETCIYSRFGIVMKAPQASFYNRSTGDDTFIVPDVASLISTSTKRMRPFWDV